MDKIYSRKRIKIPKIKHKKTNKLFMFIFLLMIILIISIGSFIYVSYPIFIASCKTAAASKATHIVNDEVQNIMNYYTYNDLIKIEKDSTGKITLMQTNTILINQLISKIVKNIQTRIDNAPTTMVYINYGSVSRHNDTQKFRPQIRNRTRNCRKN